MDGAYAPRMFFIGTTFLLSYSILLKREKIVTNFQRYCYGRTIFAMSFTLYLLQLHGNHSSAPTNFEILRNREFQWLNGSEKANVPERKAQSEQTANH